MLHIILYIIVKLYITLTYVIPYSYIIHTQVIVFIDYAIKEINK